MTQTHNAKPVVLLILDGWGHREDDDHNAIRNARTPVWDRLWQGCPHALLSTSGEAVGLPDGQMGNSEVGHLNLGAGRVVYQEFTRISRAIRTGEFYSNPALTEAVDLAVANGKAVHILGLLSPGGVHSHEEHIHAMVRLAVQRGATKVYMHAILDGRDMPPRSAEPSLRAMEELFAELGTGAIATLMGRYYAMDRDQRWERVQAAYDLMTLGRADYEATNALEALQQAYVRDEGDEFVRPTRIVSSAGAGPVLIQDGDAVVFMNYRADRARQLTRSFIDPEFDGFKRACVPQLARFVSLTEYSEDFPIPAAFPPLKLRNVFGEYVAALGRRQLRLAETEKYAHVTFFFSGGHEAAFPGEDRILVPSPKVATYDLKPEMSAEEVTDRLVTAIESDQYDVIICNYANPDMVGHTGKLEAAICAIETVDRCLGRVVTALEHVGGEMLITADHGNAEQMIDRETRQAHTAHTQNRVPLIYVGRNALLRDGGSLCDVAPTLLQLMGLAPPSEMEGRSLVTWTDAKTAAER